MNEVENNFEKISNYNINNYDNNMNNNMRIFQLEKDNNILLERNKLLEERLQNLEQFIASNISNNSNNSIMNNVTSNNSYIFDKNKPQSINNNINNNYNINNSVINDASLIGINPKQTNDINISEKIIHKKITKKNSKRVKTPNINNLNSNRKKNASSKKINISNQKQPSNRNRKSLNKSITKTNNNSKINSIRTSFKKNSTNTSFNISKKSSKSFKSVVQSVMLPSKMLKKSDNIKFKTNRERDEYDLNKLNEMIEDKKKEIESLEYELYLQNVSKKGEGYLQYELDLWQNKTNTLSTVFYQNFNNLKSEAYLDKNEFQSLIHNMKIFCENNQSFEENVCEDLVKKQKWFINNYENQNAELKKKLQKIKNVFK